VGIILEASKIVLRAKSVKYTALFLSKFNVMHAFKKYIFIYFLFLILSLQNNKKNIKNNSI